MLNFKEQFRTTRKCLNKDRLFGKIIRRKPQFENNILWTDVFTALDQTAKQDKPNVHGGGGVMTCISPGTSLDVFLVADKMMFPNTVASE